MSRVLKYEIIDSPTKNYSKRLRVPTMIVVHHTADENVKNVLQWFHDPRSERSAHFVIEKTGQIHQLVPENGAAWHCRGENQKSFGIEVVAKNRPMTQDQDIALEWLCGYLLCTYKLPYTAITAHKFTEGAATECPGVLFEKYDHVFGWAKTKFSRHFPVRGGVS